MLAVMLGRFFYRSCCWILLFFIVLLQTYFTKFQHFNSGPVWHTKKKHIPSLPKFLHRRGSVGNIWTTSLGIYGTPWGYNDSRSFFHTQKISQRMKCVFGPLFEMFALVSTPCGHVAFPDIIHWLAAMSSLLGIYARIDFICCVIRLFRFTWTANCSNTLQYVTSDCKVINPLCSTKQVVFYILNDVYFRM